jgi:hypothetical protein
VVDGPLDVLRAAEGAGRPAGQAGQRPASDGGQGEPAVALVVDHAAAGREHGRPPRVLAADQAVGATVDRRDEQAVGAARDRVGAEQHTAPPGGELGLDEHGHAGVGHGGPAARGEDVVDGRHEALPVGDVEDRGEHTGHRGRAPVLVGRRRAHDQAALALGAEAVPGGAGRTLAVEARGVGPAAVVPGRGQHDAGQDGEAGLAGAGEVGCFGADERPVGRTRLGEIEKVGAAESGGRRLHSATVSPAACTPVADGLQAA